MKEKGLMDISNYILETTSVKPWQHHCISYLLITYAFYLQ